MTVAMHFFMHFFTYKYYLYLDMLRVYNPDDELMDKMEQIFAQLEDSRGL